MMQIAIIGVGRIGSMLADKTRDVPLVYSHHFSQSRGYKLPFEDVLKSEDIVLAVNSDQLIPVLKMIKRKSKGATIINACVGFTPSMLEKILGKKFRVIHLIPSMSGKFMPRAWFGFSCSDKEFGEAKLSDVFPFTEFAYFEEKDIPEATALISCLPAFAYSWIQAIREKFPTVPSLFVSKNLIGAVLAFEDENGRGGFLDMIGFQGDGATGEGRKKMQKNHTRQRMNEVLLASKNNVEGRIRRYMEAI